jgi:hypothetical protein
MLAHSSLGSARANDIPGLFKNGSVTVYPKKGTPEDQVKQQTEAALQALTNLTFLSDNDARQYARNIQSLLGYYAYLGPDKNVVLLGGSQLVKDQKVDLKDAIVFKGVIKSGYNVGIGIPVLKIDLKGDQAAEVSIQDVVTIASRYSPDEIACNFPYAWRKSAKPDGPTQYYYVPAATVSSMATRRFDSSNQGLSGVFSILNIGANRYYSNEASTTKYFVTLSVAPVSPLDAETCKQVAQREKEASPQRDVDFITADAEASDEEEVLQDLELRQNATDLRGETLGVKIEQYPPTP